MTSDISIMVTYLLGKSFNGWYVDQYTAYGALYADADMGGHERHAKAASKSAGSQDAMSRMLLKKQAARYSPGDAQKYYTDKGRAPKGWGVKDGKVYQKKD